MTTPRIPLSVLDLSAFGQGRTPADGLRETLDLARHVEALGYRRFWLAEHHLNPGISGSAPHALLAAIAAVTDRIRLGTAVTVLGNATPLIVAEAFGVVASLHPGRLDLGIGRSGASSPSQAAPAAQPSAPAADRVVDGLLLPAPRSGGAFDPRRRPRFAAQARLLGRTPGDGDGFAQDVADLLALLDGTYVSPEGLALHAVPAEGADVDVWIHGSSAGPSARLAGELGLPFGANYHVAPSAVLDAVAEYRASFRPGRIARPYVTVSADVLVAPTDEEARRLGAGYDRWVHSIRAGDGAIPYPTPEQALAAPLPPHEREVVQDRLDTRFVGDPATVVGGLRTLARATGADELLVTTLAHDPEARRRSFALLAHEWRESETPAR